MVISPRRVAHLLEAVTLELVYLEISIILPEHLLKVVRQLQLTAGILMAILQKSLTLRRLSAVFGLKKLPARH